MDRTLKVELQGLFQKINRLERQELGQQETAQLRKAVLEAQRACEMRGVSTAFSDWRLAVFEDMAGNVADALRLVTQAVSGDMGNATYWHSLEVIVRNAKAALVSPTRTADDPGTPAIYKNLLDLGDADDACHLAMARYLAATNDFVRAMAILDSLVQLSPTYFEAWHLRGHVAAALGQHDLAKECALQVSALKTVATMMFTKGSNPEEMEA